VHKFKETQVVHSATELNKRRAQWPKLHFKTKTGLAQGFEKCPWRKLHKGSNGINIPVKFYLNHGPQEPEIYNANIPGVSNMIR
jgi:hypothetical protein